MPKQDQISFSIVMLVKIDVVAVVNVGKNGYNKINLIMEGAEFLILDVNCNHGS